MSTNHELLKRITARPDVFVGKPIIRDLRVSLELVLSLLAKGVAPEVILDDYSELDPTISGPAQPTPTLSSQETPWPPSPLLNREVLGRPMRRTPFSRMAPQARSRRPRCPEPRSTPLLPVPFAVRDVPILGLNNLSNII